MTRGSEGTTWRTLRPRPWERPIALAGLSELLYLLYYHAVAAPQTPRLFPWLPFGGWTAPGPDSAGLLYGGCATALFLLYAALLRGLSRRSEGRGDARAVFWGAALFSLTLVFLPRLLSNDLFDHIGHGRVLSAHGANPYATPASATPGDAFTRAMGWSGATPIHGPAWTSLCALLSLLGGESFLGSVLVFKLFFAAVHLVNGWLVMQVARGGGGAGGRPGRPLRAAAFYLWNPLVLTQTAGEAHNDAVVLLWLLLGIWLLQRRDDAMGAACAAMSVMIRQVTAPVALLLAVQRYRESGARRALLFAASCAAVACLTCAPYLSGLPAAHFLRAFQHTSYQGGLMMLVEMALRQVIPGAGAPGSPLAAALVAVNLAAAAGLGVWLVRACLRARRLEEAVETGARLLLLYLLLVAARLSASDVVGVVGLAAVATSVTLRRTAAIFSCSVMALEVLEVFRLLLPEPAPPQSLQRLAAASVAVGAPILYLLVRSGRWRSKLGRRAGAGESEAL